MLDEIMKNTRGIAITSKDEKGDEIKMTIRDVLINILDRIPPKQGANDAATYRLGLFVAQMRDISELGTEQKADLLQKVKETEIYYSVIKGQLISLPVPSGWFLRSLSPFFEGYPQI